MYLDANNSLVIQWVNSLTYVVEEFGSKDKILQMKNDYVLEVNLEYTKELHDCFKDLPIASKGKKFLQR